jgi:hypothetical protein
MDILCNGFIVEGVYVVARRVLKHNERAIIPVAFCMGLL